MHKAGKSHPICEQSRKTGVILEILAPAALSANRLRARGREADFNRNKYLTESAPAGKMQDCLKIGSKNFAESRLDGGRDLKKNL
jgi:ribose 1,5-bisphosphokinase PhnN